MALYRTILAIILSASLLALATVPLSAAKAARELRVETTVPQYGYSMGVGFGSLWMMSGGKVVRIDVGENSTTDLPIEGVIGLLGGPLQSRYGRGRRSHLGARCRSQRDLQD